MNTEVTEFVNNLRWEFPEAEIKIDAPDFEDGKHSIWWIDIHYKTEFFVAWFSYRRFWSVTRIDDEQKEPEVEFRYSKDAYNYLTKRMKAV